MLRELACVGLLILATVCARGQATTQSLKRFPYTVAPHDSRSTSTLDKQLDALRYGETSGTAVPPVRSKPTPMLYDALSLTPSYPPKEKPPFDSQPRKR
jgi:hypothetical protein